MATGANRRRKQIRRTRPEHNVAAPPGRVVDQAPLVAGAGRVRCDQHVAGPDDETLTVAGGEFERAGERDDVLRPGASCQSKEECGGDSLKCAAMTSVR